MPEDALTPKVPYKSAFISHAGEDHVLALDLVRRLEACGCKCWISKRNIAPGSQWDREIMQGLRNSEVIILILTEASNASEHVEREVKLAFGMRKQVVPIRFGSVEPSDTLAYWLASQQLVDATADEVGLNAMMDALCGGELVPPPPPSPPPPPVNPWPYVIGGLLAALIVAGAFVFTHNAKEGPNPNLGTGAAPVPPPAQPAVVLPKVELLTLDDQPVQGKTIQAKPVLDRPASNPTPETGFLLPLKIKLLEGRLPSGCMVQIEYNAAVEGEGAGPETVLLDREVLWPGKDVGQWSPAYQCPAGSEYSHFTYTEDKTSQDRVSGTADFISPPLTTGSKGRVPAGRMHMRLSYLRQIPGAPFIVASSQPPGSARTNGELITQTDFWVNGPAKFELLTPDGKPLEGQTISATRAIDEPASKMENGVDYRIKLRLARGGWPARIGVQLQYNADVAPAGPSTPAQAVLVDPAMLWKGDMANWCPVYLLPAGSEFTHSYFRYDSSKPDLNHSADVDSALQLFVGKAGRLPAGKMQARVLYYSLPSDGRYLIPRSQPPNSVEIPGELLAKADFTLEIPPVP